MSTLKSINKRTWLRLFVGLTLCALSIFLETRANIGMGSWSVFHQGLSKNLHISFGQISIMCSLIIIIVVSLIGLLPGIGTILNMLVIGWLVDFFDFIRMIPIAGNMAVGILMMIVSMILYAYGSYLYISCEMGCGPRDGLMSELTKKTHLPVGIVRFFIEGSVFLVGWRLGGQVGIGTIIYVLGTGICMNLVYKVMKFDIASVRHRTLCEIRGGK